MLKPKSKVINFIKSSLHIGTDCCLTWWPVWLNFVLQEISLSQHWVSHMCWRWLLLCGTFLVLPLVVIQTESGIEWLVSPQLCCHLKLFIASLLFSLISSVNFFLRAFHFCVCLIICWFQVFPFVLPLIAVVSFFKKLFLIRVFWGSLRSLMFCVCRKGIVEAFRLYCMPWTVLHLLKKNDTCTLCIPSVHTKTYGQHAFSHSAPTLWNKLSKAIWNSDSAPSFEPGLKSHLFWFYIWYVCVYESEQF